MHSECSPEYEYSSLPTAAEAYAPKNSVEFTTVSQAGLPLHVPGQISRAREGDGGVHTHPGSTHSRNTTPVEST